MTSLISFFLFLSLAVLMQGCQALPTRAANAAPTFSAPFGAAIGLGIILGVPLAAWGFIHLRRHINNRRDRQRWRRQMTVALKAEMAKEEATVARIPRFGGGQEVTKPSDKVYSHIKDSGPPPSPVASLFTIDE